MAKRKTRRGRPKGAENREYDVVAERHATCPHCGDTRRTVVRKVGEHDIAGLDPWTHRPFTHIIRRIVRCEGCQRCYAVRTYENRASEKQSRT